MKLIQDSDTITWRGSVGVLNPDRVLSALRQGFSPGGIRVISTVLSLK